MNFVEKFFVFCAGADSFLLSLCPRHIKHKYVCVGILVFITAFAAAGYTFWTIFELQSTALGLGALWSTFILNLDRFLLATFPKGAHYSRQIAHAIPRLLLAVAIGVTIAHPLMLRLFQREIIDQVASDNEAKLGSARNDERAEENSARQEHAQTVQQLPQWRELDQRKKEASAAQALLHKCNDEVTKAEDDLRCELDGGCGTGIHGNGSVAKAKNVLLEKRKTDCERLLQDFNLAGLRQRQAEESLRLSIFELGPSLQARLNKIASDHKATLERLGKPDSPSFLTRSEALSNILNNRAQARATHYGMMLLLVLVEVVPILMKLLAPRDSLDELIWATDNEFRERIPHLAKHLAEHSHMPAAGSPEPQRANTQVAASTPSALARKRLRAAAVIFVTVSIMAWLPRFSLSVDVAVASAGLFVAVAPFILTLLGEASAHGGDL